MVSRPLQSLNRPLIAAGFLFGALAAAAAPAEFPLIKNKTGTVEGNVKIDQDEQGLTIWVGSRGPAQRVEVWVAASTPVALPPVGWGHQFGYVELESEAGCAAPGDMGNTSPMSQKLCRDWFRRQAKYRRALKKLFLRQWQITPSSTTETYAAPVFESLDADARRAAAPLKPARAPRLTNYRPEKTGTVYEIHVPWDALPPLADLNIAELKILVDVFGGGTFSSISKTRKYGDPSTFATFFLAAPRRYDLTSCRYDLSPGFISGGKQHSSIAASTRAAVYFLPTVDTRLDKTLIVDNLAAGYQYDPSTNTMSPTVFESAYWTKKLGMETEFCGPPLAVAGGPADKTAFIVDDPGALEAKALPGGDLLVKYGPRVHYSYYGSGQCGGCPRVSLEFFHMDTERRGLTQSFMVWGVADPGLSEVEMEVAPDWKTITVYNSRTTYPEIDMTQPLPASGPEPITTWKSADYCWDPVSKKYAACGENQNVLPPEPRRFKFDY